jgi:hypothetical protein
MITDPVPCACARISRAGPHPRAGQTARLRMQGTGYRFRCCAGGNAGSPGFPAAHQARPSTLERRERPWCQSRESVDSAATPLHSVSGRLWKFGSEFALTNAQHTQSSLTWGDGRGAAARPPHRPGRLMLPGAAPRHSPLAPAASLFASVGFRHACCSSID